MVDFISPGHFSKNVCCKPQIFSRLLKLFAIFDILAVNTSLLSAAES
jgi:hypothetical protein